MFISNLSRLVFWVVALQLPSCFERGTLPWSQWSRLQTWLKLHFGKLISSLSHAALAPSSFWLDIPIDVQTLGVFWCKMCQWGTSYGLSLFLVSFICSLLLVCLSPPSSHIHFSLCLLLGEDDIVKLALPFSLFLSLHPSVSFLWPPPGCGRLLPPSQPCWWVFEQSDSERTKGPESDGWPFLWPSPFPFPDFSPLIAFPGLGFAGNGLKHDMSLTRCLAREREGVP